jgi:hypothetical protein
MNYNWKRINDIFAAKSEICKLRLLEKSVKPMSPFMLTKHCGLPCYSSILPVLSSLVEEMLHCG